MIDIAWMISHALDIKTSMWVGFNAKLLNDTSVTQTLSYVPPINLSPKDPAVVLETMKRATQVAAECNQKYIAVTYDLAIGIAKIAMHLQSCTETILIGFLIILVLFTLKCPIYMQLGHLRIIAV